MTDDCYSCLQDHDSKHIYDLNINLFAALFTDEYSNTFYSQASWGRLEMKSNMSNQQKGKNNVKKLKRQ